MISNFAYISQPWTNLAASLQEAEQQVYTAPSYAAVLCRKSLEEWVKWLYVNDGSLKKPFDISLNGLLYQQDFKDLVSTSLQRQLNLVRKLGNDAAHTNIKITPVEALHALQIMYGFTCWVVRMYSPGLPHIPAFNPDIIPTEGPEIKSKERIAELEKAFQSTQDLNRNLQAELDRLKAIKEEHKGKVPPPVDPNEAVTRDIYINLLLREAGWEPNGPNVAEFPVAGMPTGNGKNDGPGYVDYVLWGDDGLPLAVVEAKRTSKEPSVGKNQAKLYADCLEQTLGRRPLIFFTNGFETWFWDDVMYPPRRVHGYYKKGELELNIQRRVSRVSLQQAAINTEIAGRDYQIEAIRAVGKVLESKGRDALLVMATGTGKTRTAVALVDVLSKCNWAKRVLFLADRTALIFQAKTKGFTEHLPSMTLVDLTKEKDNLNNRIVFSTYQTMINLIDNEFDGNSRHFGVGHFDVIIFDEIHRSVYNRYKAIFEYFDGYRIGLTATPRDEGDRDTYHLFGLQPGDPTFAYELDQAVKEKHLVPQRSISVPTKFHRQGIKYADLTPEEQVAYEEMFADPITGEFPDEVDSGALNTWLYNANTVDQILAYLMKNGIKVAGGDRLGKTIVFARSHKHALFIEDRFNKQFPHLKGDFCKIIDNYDTYAHDILKNFSEKDKGPHIAISVDMLDTGIDVPEVVNLVFYKPVKSRTKFWQMIGRGTRLCPDLFGPGDDKTEFVIFDFCENFEFFGKKPAGLEGSQGKSITVRLFEQRLKLIFFLQKRPEPEYRAYAEELKTYLFILVGNLDENSFLVRQHWREVEKYRDIHRWNALNELDVKELVDYIAGIVFDGDDDEAAKRFDLLCFNMQLGLLKKGIAPDHLISETMEIAGSLTKRGAIPMVAAKMDLLKEVSQKNYWADITVLKIETIRKELRDLMKFLERQAGLILYSNFEDEILDAGQKPHEQSYGGLEAYKRRMVQYVLEHKNNLVINKLRTNQPITTAEINDLERMLFEQGEVGNKEEFVKAYGNQPLGKFIRSIVGMDIQATRTAFSKFINNPALNPQQIRFVDMIIQYLSTNGIIDIEKLFEPPFTDISSHGLLGVFNKDQVDDLVRTINLVNEAAA